MDICHFYTSLKMVIFNDLFFKILFSRKGNAPKGNAPLVRYKRTRDTIQKTHSRAMQGRRQKTKGTTPCPYCSCAVNNFHIGRHISREHTQRAAASTVLTQRDDDPNTPPPNNDAEAVIRDDGDQAVITRDVDLAVITDEEDDSNIDAETDDEDDEDDEAEKTVEDYLSARLD